MKKILILLLIPIFLFISCSKTLPSSEYILNELIGAEKNRPDGKIHLSNAAEGDISYTSPELLASVYGENGDIPEICSQWVEFAFFLSSAPHPCEFAVILCRDADSASDTSKLLCRRLDTLKNAWKDTKYSSYTDLGIVVVKENFCALIISSDAEALQKTFLSAVN